MDGEEDADQRIASLPRELLSHVLSLLDVRERSFASHVCRRWRAAALEPPHSTTLSLRLRHEWQVDEDTCTAQIETCTCLTASSWEELDQRLQAPEVCVCICAAWAPDPTALTEAEMRLALGSPLARGVTTLRVALGRAAGAPPAAAPPAAAQDADVDGGVRLVRVGIRRWPVRALLEALPASVTSLEVRHSEFDARDVVMYTIERDLLFGQLDALQELAPQLRELSLRNICWCLNDDRSFWVPKHAGLERLDAESLEFEHTALLRDLPSLRRISSCVVFHWPERLGPEDVSCALAALAERGLRVRSLSLLHEDLAYEGMVEALSAIFDPAVVGPGSGPAGLWLRFDSLPDGGLPEAFGAGAEQIECHGSPRRSILPWLTAMSRGQSLRKLDLWIRDERGCRPREVLESLQGCREGLRVELGWDMNIGGYNGVDTAEFADACAFVARDRNLIRAVSIKMPWAFRPVHGAVNANAADMQLPFWRYRAEKIHALAEDGKLDNAEKLGALHQALGVQREAKKLREQIGPREPTGRERSDLEAYESLMRCLLDAVPEDDADAEVARLRARFLSELGK